MSPLRIALLGSRGIPASYGGYETLVEELAARLAASGEFEVTVYGRRHEVRRGLAERGLASTTAVYRGARLVILPTWRSRHLDTPVHTLLSALHALREDFDAILVVNHANALFVPLLKTSGAPVALHADGLEQQRGKWGLLGRTVYELSERLACFVSDRLVTDAAVIRDHYRERYGAESRLLVYGVAEGAPAGRAILDRLGLEPRRYFLYVSRFEPENNPHRVAEAYRLVGGDVPLVMLGDAPHQAKFIAELKTRADRRIVFPGALYGEPYCELQSHALAYIQATEVGGTHPALVEAMGFGNCVVVNDTEENREVAGETGRYFRAAEPASLAARLEEILADPAGARADGERARVEAQGRFSWDRVVAEYAQLFRELAGKRVLAPRDWTETAE